MPHPQKLNWIAMRRTNIHVYIWQFNSISVGVAWQVISIWIVREEKMQTKNANYAFKRVDKGEWSEQHRKLRLESTRNLHPTWLWDKTERARQRCAGKHPLQKSIKFFVLRSYTHDNELISFEYRSVCSHALMFLQQNEYK